MVGYVFTRDLHVLEVEIHELFDAANLVLPHVLINFIG